MNLPETLTKENFFNSMMEKYPEQMKQFCEWIDEYKKKVDWAGLFNEGWRKGYHISKTVTLEVTVAPKYHELPYAMQLGIWIEYVSLVRDLIKYEVEFQYDLKSYIEFIFECQSESK